MSLASFTSYNLFEVSVLHFFIRLNSIVWVPPFLYSSIHGLLAIVNSPAMNIRVQVLVYLFSILWGIYLQVELLGCMIMLGLTF